MFAQDREPQVPVGDLFAGAIPEPRVPVVDPSAREPLHDTFPSYASIHAQHIS